MTPFRDAIHGEYSSYDSGQKRFISAAQRLYGKDGEIEVDDETVVSEGADGEGSYVLGWLWVSNDEAAKEAAEED